jgi:hypothetical protein
MKADALPQLSWLLTRWREGHPEWNVPGITEVFLAALGTDGKAGFQCELGFGDGTTKSFQAGSLPEAITATFDWAKVAYK